jgi:hypothetical protein
MSRIILYLCIVSSLSILAISFILGGYISVFTTLILIALFGLLAEWRGWTWFASIWLLTIAGAAVYGILVELSPFWILTSIISALMAWDLSRLIKRLKISSPEDDPKSLEMAHLRNLFIFMVTAFVIGSLAMRLQFRITYTQAIILIVVAFAGIMQLIRWYRRNRRL